MNAGNINDARAAGPWDVLKRNGETRPSCIVCGAQIVENRWFCRLPGNANGERDPKSLNLLLCSPRCAIRRFATPRGNGFDEDYDRAENSVHLLIDGEKPEWL